MFHKVFIETELVFKAIQFVARVGNWPTFHLLLDLLRFLISRNFTNNVLHGFLTSRQHDARPEDSSSMVIRGLEL